VLLLIPSRPSWPGPVPWLRAEGRTNSAEFGTSIVLVAQSMTHSPDETRVAIARHRPARGPTCG
jgi:hypothetical protein